MSPAKNSQDTDRANWKVGQRVARTNGDELGVVVEASASTVKVKWDGGATSYYRPQRLGSVKPATSNL